MSGESRYLSVVLFFIVQTKKKKMAEGETKERRGRHAKQKRKVWAQSTVKKTEMWGTKSASEYNGSGGPHHHSLCESQKKRKKENKQTKPKLQALFLPPSPATPPKCLALTDFWVPADLTPSGSLSFLANYLWDPPKITKKKNQEKKEKLTNTQLVRCGWWG